jgi:hypothetical protein
MTFNTSLPAAELVSGDSATEISATPRRFEALQQFAKVFHATRQPVQLGHDDAVDLPGFHQREQPLDARSLQTLRRLAAIHDDVE